MSEPLAWRRFEMAALGGTRRRLPTEADPGAAEAARAAATEAEARASRAAAHAEGEAARIAALGASFAAALREAESELAERLLEVALEIARQVLRSEVRQNREALLPVVREAIRALPEASGRPQLFVNPADLETLRAHAGEVLSHGGWTVIEDARIEPGGCRVSAAQCDMDATLATRWRRVLGTLGKEEPWNDG